MRDATHQMRALRTASHDFPSVSRSCARIGFPLFTRTQGETFVGALNTDPAAGAEVTSACELPNRPLSASDGANVDRFNSRRETWDNSSTKSSRSQPLQHGMIDS